MIFFLIFIIIPLIEVGLFISIGDEIGMINTLLLCVLTAIIGSFLLRAQGLKTILSARSAMLSGSLPVNELFDGFCLAIAGVTLMTPGFFTDAVGFALLVPTVRTLLRKELSRRFNFETVTNVRGQEQHYEHRQDSSVIEGDYKRVDDDEA